METKKFTNAEFFDYEKANGLTQDNEQYKQLHYGIADYIISRFNPNAVLEIGPGPGAIMERLAEKNILCWGIDQNEKAYEYFCLRNEDLKNLYFNESVSMFFPKLEHAKKIFTLNSIPLKKKAIVLNTPVFDVCVSIEVFEHIHDIELANVFEELPKYCKWFMFSSTPHKTTPEFDAQWGHINVKPTQEWIDIFNRHGFTLVEQIQFPTPWTLIFKSLYYED